MNIEKIEKPHKFAPVVVNDRYLLKDLIYSGSQFNIYNAIDKLNIHRGIVVKISNVLTEQQINHQKVCRLIQQCKRSFDINQILLSFYLYLAQIVPKIIETGDISLQKKKFYYYVQQKAGPNLKFCFKGLGKRFSLTTICLIAIKTLNLLEVLHSQNYVHRTLNLKNILCVAKQNESELFLSEFDYACKYKKNNQHIKWNSSKNQLKCSINKYSSVGAHLNAGPSPKDDLQSLWYIILDLLHEGDLFNRINKKVTYEQKMKNILHQKEELIPELCVKKITELLQYYQMIQFSNNSDFPLVNYDALRQPFKHILNPQNKISRKGFSFDWIENHKERSMSYSHAHQSEKTSQHSSHKDAKSPQQQTKLKVSRSQNIILSSPWQSQRLPIIDEKAEDSFAIIFEQRRSRSGHIELNFPLDESIQFFQQDNHNYGKINPTQGDVDGESFFAHFSSDDAVSISSDGGEVPSFFEEKLANDPEIDVPTSQSESSQILKSKE